MAGFEQIIRPFASPDIFPTPFHPAGGAAAPLVHVRVGFPGGTKTFGTSSEGSTSYRMGNIYKETAPQSTSIQSMLAAYTQAFINAGGVGDPPTLIIDNT